jgi:hypothetical protein
METMENYEEEEDNLEIVEDTGRIEKVKKPHAKKGQPATDYQLANLAKGREVRKQRAMEIVEEKAKAVVLKKPELVRQVAQSAMPDPPPKPPKKKKGNKQVIVFQDESSSESDDEPQQIIIKRKSKKKAKAKQPQVIQYESSSSEEEEDDEGYDELPAQQQYQQPPQIVFRRTGYY